MSIKFTIHGIEITASTAVEAAALIRELAPAVPPRPLTTQRLEPVNGTVAGGILGFLTMISEAGSDGVVSEDLMQVLHTRHAKGVGGKIAGINNELKAMGYTPKDVYRKSRTAAGRVWKTGPKMREALAALNSHEKE